MMISIEMIAMMMTMMMIRIKIMMLIFGGCHYEEHCVALYI